MKPFRWDLTKKEQLGRLFEGERADAYYCFFEELEECAAKVVAASNGHDMVFVGRSPESLFDYLTGVLESTEYQNRVIHLNMSNRYRGINQVKGESPFNLNGLKNHCRQLGLSPTQIIHSDAGVCFVDLVCYGGTYEQLFSFLLDWCRELHEDFNAMKRKMRFVGITMRERGGPNTWRWQQHAHWVEKNHDVSVTNIAISSWLWSYLGESQAKVALSNAPETWGSKSVLIPPRGEKNLQALRLAYEIYCLGKRNKPRFLKLDGVKRSLRKA